MGTAIERSSATTNLSQRGASFGIPGEQVDGMDVRAVKAAGDKAVQWARAGKGPYILEMLTYRYRGHSMSDPAKYRTREEVDKELHGIMENIHKACAEAAAQYSTAGNYADGANIAGFLKVADSMLAQGLL